MVMSLHSSTNRASFKLHHHDRYQNPQESLHLFVNVSTKVRIKKMAAEFDSSKFSAIENFFGNETKQSSVKKLTRSSTADSNVGRRVGVGIGGNNKNRNTYANYQSPNLSARQVLSVGRKRSRDNFDEVTSKEYDSNGFDIHGSHDADEMFGGRTSLETNHKKELENRVEVSKQKKKLGKKERKRQNHGASVERPKVDPNKEHQPSCEISLTENNTDNPTTRTKLRTKNGKRKRRKVRSRQKNIRKDNRSVDEKPSHLIPGNSNYQGRPMTKATHKKLNLPQSRERCKSNKIKAHGPSLFVIDRGQDYSEEGVGAKLAIDEFMNDDIGKDNFDNKT